MEELHFRQGNDHPHRPPTLQFMQTQGKLQNDRHHKCSIYLQQFHMNIKYKKGSTNNVTNCLSQPSFMEFTSVLNSCGHETVGWLHLYKSDLEFDNTYQTLLEGKQVQDFTSKMHCYATWETCVFLQAIVARRFSRRITVGSLDISGQGKQWKCYRSIFIDQTFSRMLGSTSDRALLTSLPKKPSRSKACILLFLILIDLGNPSPWINCQAFLLLSMAMILFSWSSTNSLRWPF